MAPANRRLTLPEVRSKSARAPTLLATTANSAASATMASHRLISTTMPRTRSKHRTCGISHGHS